MQTITSIESYHALIDREAIVVIHVLRENCNVCHAVLPQIESLVSEYDGVVLGVINQTKLKAIAGELSIFTVPVDIIYYNGKEMHRQGRFIDMQLFEHQLKRICESHERLDQ